MFQSWRLPLREAEEAFEHGRLDEACRLIAQHQLKQVLAGSRLAARTADHLAQRARYALAKGDLAASWRDWQLAENLVGLTDSLLSLRQALIQCELEEVERQLIAGDLDTARHRLNALERRGVANVASRTLEQVTRQLEEANQLARQGRFREAESHLESAIALWPDWEFLTQQCHTYQAQRVRSQELTAQLHRAMLADDWSQALALADELLEVAPEYTVAKDARRRAKKMVDSQRAAASADLSETRVGLASKANRHPPRASAAILAAHRPPYASTLAVDETLSNDPQSPSPRTPERQGQPPFLLWVDGVGGYLVCLRDEVALGQAAPENLTGPERVDIAIRGDLSRRHAIIRRRGEAYTLEPLGPVLVNGQTVYACTLLRDQMEIVLGEAVRLRFRQPHPLSATARLDFLGRQRSQPYSDAVLLMAESCVLGPSERNHVVCRDWRQDLVLYRQGDALFCRTLQPIEIDGRPCQGQSRLTHSSRIVGDNFSVTLEEI